MRYHYNLYFDSLCPNHVRVLGCGCVRATHPPPMHVFLLRSVSVQCQSLGLPGQFRRAPVLRQVLPTFRSRAGPQDCQARLRGTRTRLGAACRSATLFLHGVRTHRRRTVQCVGTPPTHGSLEAASTTPRTLPQTRQETRANVEPPTTST